MFILWMPMSAFYRYLKTYRLRGLFHVVFDVGFGVHVMTTVLLATFYENQRLYLMLLPAVAALLLIQKGGYLPETRSPFKDSEE